ncbi:hypothetical protein B0H10DRAFT_418287 [Mycena sp. CBHHK59/15]|nr:hypothetical protein B0H10DRAFT_418287 [Mycena sp. CBHHK59/15]
MTSYTSSLDLLAQVAECSAYHDSDDSDKSSSIPLSFGPFPSSSFGCGHQPKTSKRSNAVNGVAASGAHQLRPRKKAHKSLKALWLHIKPKLELKARREELLDRACGIRSLENSPVNEHQLIVLRTVYDEITMYPSEPWLALIAVISNRSLKQTKNWYVFSGSLMVLNLFSVLRFSNERQKNRWGDVVITQTDMGERLRLRPSAIELCDQWSDAFFEEVLMIVNYKTVRRLQWERAQAMTRFVNI